METKTKQGQIPGFQRGYHDISRPSPGGQWELFHLTEAEQQLRVDQWEERNRRQREMRNRRWRDKVAESGSMYSNGDESNYPEDVGSV